MLTNNIVVFDLESTSKSTVTAQITQIAACVLNTRLEIVDKFDSYVNIEFDEDKCKKLNLAPLTEEVIKLTGIQKETIEKAPNLKVVWSKFVDWVNLYNYKKTRWTSPIPAGWNSDSYDLKIINRICKEYGPYDEIYETNSLFHPINSYDAMKIWNYWSCGLPEIKSISLDNTRDYFGIKKDGAHNAIVDVQHTAEILIRFLKFSKTIGQKTSFKGCFENKNE